jgi:hypothetical protein
MHIEMLVEEPSAEAFFRGFLPRILPENATCEIIVFQGKNHLLANLRSRLLGYAAWIPEDFKIVVLLDEDREDCAQLKARMEREATLAGLMTKSRSRNGTFTVLNRIAVEELEAWFLGDAEGLYSAYPRVPPSLGSKSRFRNPDAISGGTWEALERVLQSSGYFKGGLRKIELARTMASHLEPERNRSQSFRVFLQSIQTLCQQS